MRRASGILFAATILLMCARARAGEPASTSAGSAVLTPLPTAAPSITATAAPPIWARPQAPASGARTPIARRWWFWAGLGAAAVAVVVTAIAISPRDTYTGNTSPGVIQVF